MVSTYLLDVGRSSISFAFILLLSFSTLTLVVSTKSDTTSVTTSQNDKRNTLVKRDKTPTYGKLVILYDQWTVYGTSHSKEYPDSGGSYRINTADATTYEDTYYNWYQDKPYKETFLLYSYNRSEIKDEDITSGQWMWKQSHKKQKCEVEMYNTTKEEAIVTIHIHPPGTENENFVDTEFAKLTCDPHKI